MDLLIAANTVSLSDADRPPAPGSPRDSTPGYATDGDPVTGKPRVRLPAGSYNALQAEIVNAIKAAGLTPDRLDWTQLAQAIKKLRVLTVNRRVITLSTTYVPPANLAWADFTAIGAGAGGGGAVGGSGTAAAAGGGGSGAVVRGRFTLAEIGSSLAISIGFPGGGGAAGNNIGGYGGNTVVGGILQANSGAPGGGGAASPVAQIGGGVGIGGQWTGLTGCEGRNGEAGGYGLVVSSAVALGGKGGSSSSGTGGPNGLPTDGASASPGLGFGGGGAGAGCLDGSKKGGDGAPGAVIITEYLFSIA